MRLFIFLLIFFSLFSFLEGQEGRYRGSIPIELLRPGRGQEALRLPIDTVIGELGQGEASDAAFSFAVWVAGGLLSGRMNHPALEFVNPLIRENYLSVIASIDPIFYRLGSGRVEPDGSTSFLIRFVGRDLAITAEMYVRHVMMRDNQEEELPEITEEINEENGETGVEIVNENIDNEYNDNDSIENAEIAEIAVTAPAPVMVGRWMLEDLLLDEAKTREQEMQAITNRMDYVPYERFF